MRWTPELPWVTRPLGVLPKTWRERIRLRLLAFRDLPRTMREDSTTELAAGMTFYLLFSTFPALLCLMALLPWMPLESPLEKLFEFSRPLLPAEVYDLVTAHIEDLVARPRTGLLTASAAVALWSASRALVSLSRALNRAYRVPLLRSELLRRLRSMLLTLGALAGVPLTILLLSLGDEIVDLVVSYGLLPLSSGALISAVRWPILLVTASFLVQQLYYLLPDQRPRWRFMSTGSVSAVLGWLVATWFFTSFAASFVEFNLTFGSLGSIAVVMAWMYIGSLALMTGASVNALVDRGLPPTERENSEPIQGEGLSRSGSDE
ncbi:MAG: hypothetical protein CMP23_01055 [Rickettsiales bacterium]|nr:hypothetical protein [Rickettsiales bacterium]|tara:strand:+ start:413 stop:1372 length:960 start_codon:yes stop_codon:yes gene_type:complete